MINFKNLYAGYNQTKIIKNLSFAVSACQITAIIGPNGAGKSTVLKSIFNLCDIHSGHINFKNKDITSLPTHDLIRMGLSLVPQGHQIFSNMTVLENLEMGAFIFNDNHLFKRNLMSIFEQFPELKKIQSRKASSLSGGQQQILAIARSLIQNPEMLILDEPSLGLSPVVLKQVFQKLVDLKKQGVGILLVEQNARQAVSIADKIIVLKNGEVAFDGPKEALDDSQLEDIYIGG